MVPSLDSSKMMGTYITLESLLWYEEIGAVDRKRLTLTMVQELTKGSYCLRWRRLQLFNLTRQFESSLRQIADWKQSRGINVDKLSIFI